MSFDLLGGQEWHVHHGDCIEHMATLPEACIDFSVFSPPFSQLYAYTDLPNDIGNSESFAGDAKVHMSFFYRQLVRVLKPGRVAVVHVAQVPRMKRASKRCGLNDFRGWNIRLAERAGLTFEYDWLVRKNPQSQAIRTRSRELQFAGLETDRAKSRGALCDYLLKFSAPGENDVPVISENEITRNDWIKIAEGCWDDINETDTLNVVEARTEADTRHICPLQLEVIRRCILLYTNPGELVLSPFAGIGSEGYMALGGASPKTGKSIQDARRFYGCELKNEYYETCCVNLERAVSSRERNRKSLFDFAGT